MREQPGHLGQNEKIEKNEEKPEDSTENDAEFESPSEVAPHPPISTRAELASLDNAICRERAGLNGVRNDLGLPPTDNSVALDALRDRRAALLKGPSVGEQLLTPGMAAYLKSLGENEVIDRLEKIGPGARLQVRAAINDGNLPYLIHLFELPRLQELQKKETSSDKAIPSKVTAAGSLGRPKQTVADMDLVTRRHVSEVLKKIKLFQQTQGERVDSRSAEVSRLLMRLFP